MILYRLLTGQTCCHFLRFTQWNLILDLFLCVLTSPGKFPFHDDMFDDEVWKHLQTSNDVCSSMSFFPVFNFFGAAPSLQSNWIKYYNLISYYAGWICKKWTQKKGHELFIFFGSLHLSCPLPCFIPLKAGENWVGSPKMAQIRRRLKVAKARCVEVVWSHWLLLSFRHSR